MWAFVLFSYSLVSPKTTPPPPSCAVKLCSSTGGMWRSNWTARQQMISLGVIYIFQRYCFQRRSAVSRLKPPDISQRDGCFSPLAVFPYLLWHLLFFLSLVWYVHISLSFLHLCLIPALFLSFNMWFSPSPQHSFALRIHKLLSCRRGHRVHTVII